MARNRTVRNITEAEVSHADDVHARTVRYLISMTIRMICFILAVLTPSPWRWGFAVAAIVLPWVAVLIANAGKEHGPPQETAIIDHEPYSALGTGGTDSARSYDSAQQSTPPDEPTGDPPDSQPEIIIGELEPGLPPDGDGDGRKND